MRLEIESVITWNKFHNLNKAPVRCVLYPAGVRGVYAGRVGVEVWWLWQPAKLFQSSFHWLVSAVMAAVLQLSDFDIAAFTPLMLNILFDFSRKCEPLPHCVLLG